VAATYTASVHDIGQVPPGVRGREPRHSPPGVQANGTILKAGRRSADEGNMSMSLRRAIDSGDYLVDPDAVAEAIMRRASTRPLVPPLSSRVLVPADLFEDAPARPDQLHPLTLDYPA